MSNPQAASSYPLLLLILITSWAECWEFNGEGSYALPVQSAVPALFCLYHISRTSRIYMDFSPPSLLCLLWEVFSLRLFFPATVLTLSLASDASGLRVSQQNPMVWCLSCFRCTCAFDSGQPTTFKYCYLGREKVLALAKVVTHRDAFICVMTCKDAFIYTFQKISFSTICCYSVFR